MMDQPLQPESVPVSELVDFEDQQSLFKKMLNSSANKRLMFIQASGTYGKTSLLRLLRSHCDEQGIPCCWVDFREQSYDDPQFSLTMEMCTQLGILGWLTQAWQFPGMCNLAEAKAVVEIGGNVVNSSIVNLIRTEVHLSPEELRKSYMRERLKSAFISDLRDLAARKGGVVCLFDSFENISKDDVEKWLLYALLCPIASGDLEGVTVVTAGRCWPRINDWQWSARAHLINSLPLMSVADIIEYAKRVGVELDEADAEWCWRASRGGNPLFMSMIIKNLLAMEEVE